MNNIILFDDDQWLALLPTCLTRPISDLRVGILKISEKWEKWLNGEVSYITKDYLAEKFPIKISSDNYVINARWLPNEKLVSLIQNLESNEALLNGEELIAARMDDKQFQSLIDNKALEELKGMNIGQTDDFTIIKRPFDLFIYNGAEIKNDFKLLGLKDNRASVNNAVIYGEHPVYIDKSATIKHAYINAEEGPVYIAKNATIQETSVIRGPFSMSENAVVKMGSKIYKDCSFGPYVKVAGELSNCVFQGYANKAHEGYLGNAYIGEWCNLGAGTISSNLKNNYSEVKVWNYQSKKFEKSGQLFCGLIMGDHSKTGINTMFNTATVVGVSANIFGNGYPRTYIPSFSWGGAQGYKTFQLDKALELADTIMKRRQQQLSDQDRIILEHIFHTSSAYRTWES